MKKLYLFIAMILMAGVSKAGWFDESPDIYTVNYSTAMAVSASTTALVVALSSNTWPHPTGARAIIVDSVQIDNDKTAATTSIVKVGVVREVNVSSGTIVWFERQGQGINVSNTNVFRDSIYENGGLNTRVNPQSVAGGASIGTTPYILSNDTLQSTLITTGLGYPNPVTGVADARLRVGDIVMNVVNSAVAATLNIKIRYHLDTK